jgi:hypothetical protein
MKMRVGGRLNSRVPTSLTRHYRCWARPTGIVSLIHFPKNRGTQGKPLRARNLGAVPVLYLCLHQERDFR